MFSSDLALQGSTFQRVDEATGKAPVQMLLLTLGSKSEQDDWSWIGFLTQVCRESDNTL